MEFSNFKGIMESNLNSQNFSSPSEFVRYPPNRWAPFSSSTNSHPLREKLQQNSASMLTRLQDFHMNYYQFAKGLFHMSPSKIIPNGHPLHSKDNSPMILKDEIEKLRKENFELKKQISELSKNKK